MPRAKSSAPARDRRAAADEPLGQTLDEKIALRALNGGSLEDVIRVRGARQHNLRNVDLTIPRNRLVVFTGVSGSGKSSLAFDTIFAEGQRRYVESLSAYARQFLGQVDKPDVDAIEGLSPAISIDQKSTSHNPRSTVGTVTEIQDYLRLLFGRAGEPHCPECDRSIRPQTIDEMVDQILTLPEGTRYQLLAPVVRGKKGSHVKLLGGLVAEGFARVRINGEVRELADNIELDKNHAHHIEVVVDRLVAREGIQERLTDSLRTALKRGDGLALVELVPKTGEELPEGLERERLYSENFACAVHGAVMEELSPRLFSFNSPYGACPDCHGIGHLRRFTAERVIPDPALPVYAAVAPWAEKDNAYYFSLLYSVGEAFGFEIKTPWNQLTAEQQDVLLHGSREPIQIQADSRYRKAQTYVRPFEGILPILERQLRDASGEAVRQKLEKYLELVPCASCHGLRLRPEALAVRVGPYRIHELTATSVGESLRRIEALMGVGESEGAEPLLTARQIQIGDLVLREIRMRLKFLLDVGLDYLSLDRPAMTLSGGEAQRIRLATQIGAGLTGVLYVLDEPSIGLHQRDNDRLLGTLLKLRDLGNTLIVVEHDEDTIRAADHLVDIGPGAGVHGGHIVAEGSLDNLLNAADSLTGAYLSGRRHPHPGRAALDGLPQAHPAGLRAQQPGRLRCGVSPWPAGERDRGEWQRQEHPGERTAAPGPGAPAGPQGAVPGRGARAARHSGDRQGDRDRPEPDRPHPPLQPRHLHRRLRPDPPGVRRHGGGQGPRLPGGPVQLQRQGGPLRGLQRPGGERDRDELPARCLRAVRRVQGGPLQPRNPAGDLQGPHHRRCAGDDGGAGRRGVLLPFPRRPTGCAPWWTWVWATSSSASPPPPSPAARPSG
jgi:excinuclease ABC subunit A